MAANPDPLKDKIDSIMNNYFPFQRVYLIGKLAREFPQQQSILLEMLSPYFDMFIMEVDWSDRVAAIGTLAEIFSEHKPSLWTMFSEHFNEFIMGIHGWARAAAIGTLAEIFSKQKPILFGMLSKSFDIFIAGIPPYYRLEAIKELARIFPEAPFNAEDVESTRKAMKNYSKSCVVYGLWCEGSAPNFFQQLPLEMISGDKGFLGMLMPQK